MATDVLSDQTRIAQPDLKGTPEFLRMLRAMQVRIMAAESASVSTLTNKTLSSFTNTVDADSLRIQVINLTGATIAAGKAVYLNGYDAASGLMKIGASDNTNPLTIPSIGITTAAILTTAKGAVCFHGRLPLDTSAFAAGAALYVGLAGALTATAPVLPAARQRIGYVLRAATLGVIEVTAEPNIADPQGMRYDFNGIVAFRARNDDAGAAAYVQSILSSAGGDWSTRTGSTAANANAWELVSDALGASTIRMKMTAAGALSVAGNFAFNGKAPIANVSAPPAAGATYGATEQAAINDLILRLKNLGVYT